MTLQPAPAPQPTPHAPPPTESASLPHASPSEPGSNGHSSSPPPAPSRLPRGGQMGWGSRFLLLGACLSVLAAGAWGGMTWFRSGKATRPDLILHKAHFEKLQL